MSFLGEREIEVYVTNQISVISPTGVALPSVVFGSLTGTSAFINSSNIETLTCSDIYSSQITALTATGSSAYFSNLSASNTTGSSAYFSNLSASNTTGSSAFFETSLYTPQLTADNTTGGNAYFNTITGTYTYYPLTGNVIGNITGNIGSFSSLLQIPTSTGTAVSGSIYYSSSDNKLHCYNPTGGWVSASLS